MQAFSAWSPPTGTLGGIVEEARVRVEALRPRQAELERQAAAIGARPLLSLALQRDDVAVIAEVKRKSPSKGWIQPSLSPASHALAYAAGGAAAISVLTEAAHFGGSTADLEAVRRAVTVPVLKKDFHVHPLQLLEAKALGASAALLIARALPPELLRELIAEAHTLQLEVLVEVRDEAELERALALDAALVGINNRNLETLVIDQGTSERLLNRVPANVIAIAESGVTGRSDVERVARAGADAVLVGSSVSAAENPQQAVALLTGIPRESRER